jgi:hypothetical protein
MCQQSKASDIQVDIYLGGSSRAGPALSFPAKFLAFAGGSIGMIKMYCFGLAPKFTGIVVAPVLSTVILVSAASFFEGRNRLRDQIIDNNEANVTLAAEFARY